MCGWPAARFGRHGLPPPVSNDTGTALGQDGSDWSRDLATLTFELRGHGACGWCGSSSTIHIPSLNAIRKIWHTMFVSINVPGGLDLWPFDLETGVRVESHQRLGTFLRNLGTLGLFVLKLFAMYATDGRTDRQKQHLLSPSLRAGVL